jgi:hypothetical protein
MEVSMRAKEFLLEYQKGKKSIKYFLIKKLLLAVNEVAEVSVEQQAFIREDIDSTAQDIHGSDYEQARMCESARSIAAYINTCK